MHEKYSDWLNLRGLKKIHASMNKASTIEVGHPDFTILRETFMVEFKVPGMRLSEVQEKRIRELRDAGNKIVVCHSFEEAIEATKEHFGL